jgi:hypothetical protein
MDTTKELADALNNLIEMHDEQQLTATDWARARQALVAHDLLKDKHYDTLNPLEDNAKAITEDGKELDIGFLNEEEPVRYLGNNMWSDGHIDNEDTDEYRYDHIHGEAANR